VREMCQDVGEKKKRVKEKKGNAKDIHIVTAQEEEEKKFSIFEVVLPVVDSEVYMYLYVFVYAYICVYVCIIYTYIEERKYF